ncbi:MAG: host attachment protein [Verrucomicrobia bacterium]|nr:host attachment protein [Verrucomicrobiota bacterium]
MSTVIVAANLGHLKAFRVAETPTRGRKLELVNETEFPEAHGRFLDKVTDMAGRFPVTEGPGPGTAMSTGEALSAELEIHKRLIQLVAERITTILNSERPEYWHFAANAEVHQAILNALAPELRERVVRHVHADLTKAPPSEVLAHFMPARAA